MMGRGKAKFDAEVFTVGPEQGADELGSVVGDDPVGDPKAAGDPPEELDR